MANKRPRVTKLIFVILVSLITCFANADVLKLGRSVGHNDEGLKNLVELGDYIVSELGGEVYTSYKVFSDREANNSKFIKLVNEEKIDIVIEELYSASLYTKLTQLEPVLLIDKKNSLYLNSYIVVRKDSAIKSIKDLGGNVLALKNRVSTPYYFLPMKEIKDIGLKTAELTDIKQKLPKDTVGYFLTNDKETTANSVYIKKADAGAVCSYEWDHNSNIPHFIKDNLKVIHKTESIPGIFVLMRKDMPTDIRNKIINILANKKKNRLLKAHLSKCRVDGFHKIKFNWRELFELITLKF
ncbi:MAG: hypothetical protein C0603_00365 [Denitrovibrio sp.]|nr:MAG: hypothetical protein C0603_00365 [Denitrovibrio sp.]